MSSLAGCLPTARLVLKLTFVVLEVSPPVPTLVVLAPVVMVMLLSRVEILKDLQTFLLLHIPVMHELRVVQRHPGQGLAKVVQSVHLVHELCRHLIPQVLVVPYYPNASPWGNPYCLRDP